MRSAAAKGEGDFVTPLSPGATTALAHLSDTEVLDRTRYLVAKSNQTLAALLEHLAEVESRGIFRQRACTSLYTYCIYELRFSEDAAARRSSAAKWVKEFPMLLEAVANGELHLTGLLMVGPLLTAENYAEVLSRAKFRTKKELGMLVRRLAPLPRVPDRVELLGPEPPRSQRNPTWAELVEALAGPVRELRPGERPSEWANDPFEAALVSEGDSARPAERDSDSTSTTALARCGASLPELEAPSLYRMQFTTTEEHAELVQRAKALMANDRGTTLGELHLQAMRLLVAALEKKRFGAPARRHKPCEVVESEGPRAAASEGLQAPESQRSQASECKPTGEPPRQRGSWSKAGSNDSGAPNGQSGAAACRHIPAAIRRAVFERDGGRCAFVDDRGVRCQESARLELHHLQPFARGGAHSIENLALRCRSHNTPAAERDFGRTHIAQQRDHCRHTPERQALNGDA